jgi:hypothetical protein
MVNAEMVKEIRKNYSFKLNDIGEALAIVTSFFEKDSFTYTAVRTYSWEQVDDEVIFDGPYYNMAIVKSKYENSDFCTNNNPNEIWRMQRLAFIFKNNCKDQHTSIILADKEIYFRIFKNSQFEYLQDFIEVLSSTRQNNGGTITREEANSLAIKYCKTMASFDDEPNQYDNSPKILTKK